MRRKSARVPGFGPPRHIAPRRREPVLPRHKAGKDRKSCSLGPDVRVPPNNAPLVR
jgi:hypothetical protein